MTVIEISRQFIHFAKAVGSDVEVTVSRRETALCTWSLEKSGLETDLMVNMSQE